MSIQWFVTILEGRSAYRFIGGVFLFVLLLQGLLYALDDGGTTRSLMTSRQILGVVLLFVCLPCYLMVVAYVQWQQLDALISALRGQVAPTLIAQVEHCRVHLSKWGAVAIAVGLVFGLQQNGFIASQMFATGHFSAFDFVFVTLNILLWGIVIAVLAWRLPVARAIGRAFSDLEPDVYDLKRLSAYTRWPAMDVLLITGALAWMPLQSLDAEFRLGNYVPGTVVGLIAATLLFSLPMLGLRRAVVRAKAKRINEVTQLAAGLDGGDVAQIELAQAHLDRLRDLPNWPVDVRLITRILAYVVLPPLAWIAAALVENFIDQHL